MSRTTIKRAGSPNAILRAWGPLTGTILAVVMFMAASSPAEMATVRLRGPRKVSPGVASGARPTGYVAETKAPPKIDGKLDDQAWKQTTVLNVTRTLDGSGQAKQATEIRLLRDAKRLYVGIRCAEPFADMIRRSRTTRDEDLWGDDSLEIFIGTDDDWDYYHIIVNSRGAFYDGFNKDKSWNGDVQAAGAVGRGEWTAEVAIGLASMNFPVPSAKPRSGTEVKRWIANFNRNRYTRGGMKELSWSPTLSGNSHVPRRFGWLVFQDPPKELLAAATGPAAAGGAKLLACAAGAGVIQFDLSAIPAAAKVYRADLAAFRAGAVSGLDDEILVNIEIHPLTAAFRPGGSPAGVGRALKLRGPWFDRFDATEAVAAWVGGKPNGGFFVKTFPLWDSSATCLDIAYEGTCKAVPPQAKQLKAFHSNGQTFLTWRESIDIPVSEDVKWRNLKALLGGMDAKQEIRYAVYRHDKPITARTLAEAELLAMVKPLSCWNVNGRSVEKAIDTALATQYALMHGNWNPFSTSTVDGAYGLDCQMERLVIREGAGPLPIGTGLYVHTCAAPGKAYYAVVSCVDGVQNTRDLSGANVLSQPLEETPATPEPVLQKEFPPNPFWSYPERRWHYVRFASAPFCNRPYEYYNWSVGEPLKHDAKMPLEFSLPRGGRRTYYRTQYRIERGSLVLTPSDFPFSTWWYGYHESQGTLKSFKQGTIHPYTERRLLAFIDWACRKWPVDRDRISITAVGRSLGGPSAAGAGEDLAGVSGALHLAIRHPDIFQLAMIGPGLADYGGEIRADTVPDALIHAWTGLWGKLDWNLKTDTGKSVWDELNLTRIVRDCPARTELPLVTYAGKLTAPTAAFFQAMLERGQPAIAYSSQWGIPKLLAVSANSTWQNVIRADVRRNLILPTFREAGALVPLKAAKGNRCIIPVNYGIDWDTEDAVDQADRCELAVSWKGRKEVTTDITLRRLQRFKPGKGRAYAWELRGLRGSTIAQQQGRIEVGKDELLTIPGVKLTAPGGRLVVTAVAK